MPSIRKVRRCRWATTPEMIAYHDREWGKPQHDDRRLFEYLVLEGAQAGLSWATILRKRSAYRALFANFDPGRVARFTPATVERIVKNPGVVRNRAKIGAAVANARAFRRVQREFGSFDAYLWSFTGGKVIRRRAASPRSTSPESEALSKDLKARGFRFVGPTICYAFMQAAGVVDDHAAGCFVRGRRKPAARNRA